MAARMNRHIFGMLSKRHGGRPRRLATPAHRAAHPNRRLDCKTGEEKSSDERYLVSSLPSVRLTPQHWLLVIRRHWGVETSHQVLDTAFAEDDHPWIEATD